MAIAHPALRVARIVGQQRAIALHRAGVFADLAQRRGLQAAVVRVPRVGRQQHLDLSQRLAGSVLAMKHGRVVVPCGGEAGRQLQAAREQRLGGLEAAQARAACGWRPRPWAGPSGSDAAVARPPPGGPRKAPPPLPAGRGPSPTPGSSGRRRRRRRDRRRPARGHRQARARRRPDPVSTPPPSSAPRSPVPLRRAPPASLPVRRERRLPGVGSEPKAQAPHAPPARRPACAAPSPAEAAPEDDPARPSGFRAPVPRPWPDWRTSAVRCGPGPFRAYRQARR